MWLGLRVQTPIQCNTDPIQYDYNTNTWCKASRIIYQRVPYQGKFDAAKRKTRSSVFANPSIWTRSSVFIRRLPSCSLYKNSERRMNVSRDGVRWLVDDEEKSSTHVPPPEEPLWLMRDSNSSRNIVDGAWNLASSNSTCNTVSHTPTSVYKEGECDLDKQRGWTPVNIYPDEFLGISSPFTDYGGGRYVEESCIALCSYSFSE